MSFVELIGTKRVVAALRAVARETGQPAALRLDALAALPNGSALDATEFDFLRAKLAADGEPATRTAAAGTLARAKLETPQLRALADNLKSAGPLELNKLCEAFDGGGDDILGLSFLAALRASKSAQALPPSQLKPHFAKFPEATQKSANEFLASLDADAAKQAADVRPATVTPGQPLRAAPAPAPAPRGAPTVGFRPAARPAAGSCANAGVQVAPGNWYVVRRGDSLWSIAQRHYRNGFRWTALRDRNRLATGYMIHPCQAVFIPR